jgi:hypothetical protein
MRKKGRKSVNCENVTWKSLSLQFATWLIFLLSVIPWTEYSKNMPLTFEIGGKFKPLMWRSVLHNETIAITNYEAMT